MPTVFHHPDISLPVIRRRAAQLLIDMLDWYGFASLGVFIGALQLVLDRGNQDDWFSSKLLIVSAIVSFLALCFFVIYSLLCVYEGYF